MARDIRPCIVQGCDRLTGVVGTARGLCGMHYQRFQKHGSLEARVQVPWNTGLTTVDPRVAAGIDRLTAGRRQAPVWNKGLTKSDPRVARNEKRRRKSRAYERIWKNDRERTRAWYWGHLEHARELHVESSHRRRARMRKAFVEPVQKARVYERDGGRCQICRRPVSYAEATVDHIVPIIRGGEHTPRNVQIAHGQCNSRKGATVDVQMRLVG